MSDLENIKVIDGGICAVDGVNAAGTREGKYGLAVIEAKDSAAAAVFTKNKVVAAPVMHTKEMMKGGKLSLIVVNSGNANCFTGQDGIDDCNRIVEFASGLTGIPSNEIVTASTGVIGRRMPMDIILPLIEEAVPKVEHSAEASTDAAKSIMTTDTYHKEFAVEVDIDGEKVTVGGITKGVGMIAPNMGTMLGFIATDAVIESNMLDVALRKAVGKSFNMIVVDGDTSTNDTAILMANGKSGVDVVKNGEIDSRFQEALEYVAVSLAKMMAQKSVISSSLVKSAIFGGDPNWGRIAAAVGYADVEMDQDMISISVSDDEISVDLVKEGEILAFDGTENLSQAEKVMQNENVNILVNLYQGDGEATAWGCDLTYDYVKINAEYTT